MVVILINSCRTSLILSWGSLQIFQFNDYWEVRWCKQSCNFDCSNHLLNDTYICCKTVHMCKVKCNRQQYLPFGIAQTRKYQHVARTLVDSCKVCLLCVCECCMSFSAHVYCYLAKFIFSMYVIDYHLYPIPDLKAQYHGRVWYDFQVTEGDWLLVWPFHNTKNKSLGLLKIFFFFAELNRRNLSGYNCI